MEFSSMPAVRPSNVQNNYIGTNAQGNALPGGNGGYGVYLRNASFNVIGTEAGDSGEGNVISGNDDGGVRILNGDFNQVGGNTIGATANRAATRARTTLRGRGLRLELQRGRRIRVRQLHRGTPARRRPHHDRRTGDRRAESGSRHHDPRQRLVRYRGGQRSVDVRWLRG